MSAPAFSVLSWLLLHFRLHANVKSLLCRGSTPVAAAAACRSRFPGLSVWLADGRRLPVSIPPGCLLCQAGKQLEWLTGGHVQAGMHEVRVLLVHTINV
jgi:hypothetical protein